MRRRIVLVSLSAAAADRMRLHFFYVKRLTFLGPYVVTQAGTGP